MAMTTHPSHIRPIPCLSSLSAWIYNHYRLIYPLMGLSLTLAQVSASCKPQMSPSNPSRWWWVWTQALLHQVCAG